MSTATWGWRATQLMVTGGSFSHLWERGGGVLDLGWYLWAFFYNFSFSTPSPQFLFPSRKISLQFLYRQQRSLTYLTYCWIWEYGCIPHFILCLLPWTRPLEGQCFLERKLSPLHESFVLQIHPVLEVKGKMWSPCVSLWSWRLVRRLQQRFSQCLWKREGKCLH